MRDDIELKLSSYLRLLIDAKSIEKGAKSISSFDEVVNKCIDCESQSRILDATICAWKASVIKLTKQFKDIRSNNFE